MYGTVFTYIHKSRFWLRDALNCAMPRSMQKMESTTKSPPGHIESHLGGPDTVSNKGLDRLASEMMIRHQ